MVILSAGVQLLRDLVTLPARGVGDARSDEGQRRRAVARSCAGRPLTRPLLRLGRAEAFVKPRGRIGIVITEQAVLDIKPGQERDFESAFAEAKALIVSTSGFESLQLHRCIEQSNRYLLLVVWRRLEDHTEGFRRSSEYEEWRQLLHHYYDPFPTVEHFNLVISA